METSITKKNVDVVYNALCKLFHTKDFGFFVSSDNTRGCIGFKSQNTSYTLLTLSRTKQPYRIDVWFDTSSFLRNSSIRFLPDICHTISDIAYHLHIDDVNIVKIKMAIAKKLVNCLLKMGLQTYSVNARKHFNETYKYSSLEEMLIDVELKS